MIPDDWFQKHVPGFAALGEGQRRAITDFTLAWSLFEGKALNNAASSSAILARCEGWAQANKLKEEPFAQALHYFRERYFDGGQPTYRYEHLHLRRNDQPGLVARVLKGEPVTASARAAVPLIIAYRFRNNLFHGTKWAYGIDGQTTNFDVSTQMLMRAIDLAAG